MLEDVAAAYLLFAPLAATLGLALAVALWLTGRRVIPVRVRARLSGRAAHPRRPR